MIGLLHQGFNAYAHQLSQAAQKEWEKVAGRFQEVLFDQPLHQINHLIGATLDLSESRVSQMHSSILARLKAQMADRRKELQQATAV